MRIRKSCGVSELRILVTKSLHGESAFDDFESVSVERLRGFDEFPASSGERFQGSLLQAELTFSVPRGGSRIHICDIGGVQTTLPRESLGNAPIIRIPRPGETGLSTELFTLDTRCSGIPL